jgi:HAD superfamily hydrolase (TIGR01509 family)
VKKFGTLLFDFDGVIGMTMEDNHKAWQQAFAGYSVSVDKTEYFLLEGVSPKMVADHFLRVAGKDPGLAVEIAKTKDEHYLGNNTFAFYPGVDELTLLFKDNGYKMGLVTGAGKGRLTKSVNPEFLARFDVVITADNVTKCKPDPEPYLTAAKMLSVNPADCAVVENAPIGIESAKNAGMYCIAICSTLDKSHLTKADVIIDKFTDLEGIILKK